MPKTKSVAAVARRVRAENKKMFLDSKMRQADGFTNFIARMGVNSGNNQMGASRYTFDYFGRNRTELEAAYRTSWIIGAACNMPAEDMTRAGVEPTGSIPPDAIAELAACIQDLKIWQRLCECITWARLFGGCIAVMLIDGQDLSKPLRPETVGKDQFKGLMVLDRWLVQPQLTNLITEFGPDLGLPKFYDVVADARALASLKIHHSRVLRFEGLDLPYYQKLVEMMWGQSVIERIHDRLVAFDSATMGAAQLVYKAHLRTIKVEDLRGIIGTGGEAQDALFKMMDLIRFSQSNEGLTLLDKEDEFEVSSYTFAGLSDIILQFGQQLSGALQIPMVRLFGQSPQGLNSTGESDLRTYYDNVAKTQETMLRQPLTRLFDIIIRSVFGYEPPADFNFKFRPLWCLQEKEKSDIAKQDAESVGQAMGDGLLSQAAAMKELKQSSEVTGRFTNISAEDIAAADQEPPSASEILNEQEEGQPGGEDPEGEGDVQPDDEVEG